jgi:hypothetical protein
VRERLRYLAYVDKSRRSLENEYLARAHAIILSVRSRTFQ